MNGLLVRVGADLTEGGGRWNGPMDIRTGQFAYVPIPETRPTRPKLATGYSAIVPALSGLNVELPAHLNGVHTHLDPDFEHLTYGDRGAKGQQLARDLARGDVIVFYAGLRDIVVHRLVYAIIGLFVVDDILPIGNVAATDFPRNAHTRREPREKPDDVIILGKPSQSGRAARCIPIGEYRAHACRVTEPLLAAWGGISANDGYLQRSAVFPSMRNPMAFWRWWQTQSVELVRRNN